MYFELPPTLYILALSWQTLVCRPSRILRTQHNENHNCIDLYENICSQLSVKYKLPLLRILQAIYFNKMYFLRILYLSP